MSFIRVTGTGIPSTPNPRITSNISLPILTSTWQIIWTIFLSGPLLNLGSMNPRLESSEHLFCKG
ncbi:hypothetical protein H5410_054642 [Solanum commersonii]|uniref:Uncharacterized protein n=1 Tax=Solanum commersonii TaxID=4109 RepID=A0A9J5WGZ6_SOLCO|nr:hypothetical protein H5410_054642 [Solanum commersonii]